MYLRAPNKATYGVAPPDEGYGIRAITTETINKDFDYGTNRKNHRCAP